MLIYLDLTLVDGLIWKIYAKLIYWGCFHNTYFSSNTSGGDQYSGLNIACSYLC